MTLSDFLIVSVGLLAILLTVLMWRRVTRRVRTEEHAVVTLAERADPEPTQIAYSQAS